MRAARPFDCFSADAAGKASRTLFWLLIIGLTAFLSYLAFRGYVDPELLLNFANSYTC